MTHFLLNIDALGSLNVRQHVRSAGTGCFVVYSYAWVRMHALPLPKQRQE